MGTLLRCVSGFPNFPFDEDAVTDPRWTDCMNPMAAAIRLADSVNTVSSVYAEEITRPSAPEQGYSGGEGLEEDLKNAYAQSRLVGILNGCTYPGASARSRSSDWDRLLDVMRTETSGWMADGKPAAWAHPIAMERLAALPDPRPGALLTSIGRVTGQKMRLFREEAGEGDSALATLLELLDDDVLFIMLGTGDLDYETFLADTAAAHPNFLFLQGYSDELSELLYRLGDLFLMPSQFEPCGIGQMLAMREGQPCVVHGVGGLKETVADDATGFVFGGATPREQAGNFVGRVRDALELRRASPGRWGEIRQAAAAMRFDWESSAAIYERTLYGIG